MKLPCKPLPSCPASRLSAGTQRPGNASEGQSETNFLRRFSETPKPLNSTPSTHNANTTLKHFQRLLVLGATLAATSSLHAATRSFYCNGANNNWSVATNWVPNGVPQSGDALVFSASSPRRDCINDLANLKLDSLQITAANFEISGNALTVSNGFTIANAAPAVSGATFTNLGATPVLRNGTYQATNNSASPQKFYRLCKP